jgi:predicted SAM-dependent methyltransferase
MLRRVKRWIRHQQTIRTLKQQIRNNHPLNVVIGSGDTSFEGWIKTDVKILDITNPADWQKLFQPQSIQQLLAEHVLEHLTEEQGRVSSKLCYEYLQKGGRYRIAVPDGYRDDEPYHSYIAPPKDGHQVLSVCS